MAFELETQRARYGALGAVLLVVGCSATTLEIGENNPGYPAQATSATARSRVLDPDFDEAALLPSPAAAPSAGVIYQCPMHPEVKRDAPGRCPICNMKLEPHPGGHAEHSSP